MTSTGGRFPSDLNISRTRDFDAPQSPSSESSDRDTINAAPAVIPIIQTNEPARKYSRDDEDPYRLRGIASHSPGMTPGAAPTYDDDQARYMANPQSYAGQQAAQDQSFFLPGQQHLNQPPASAYQQQPIQQQPIQQQPNQPVQRTFDSPSAYERSQSSYGDWMAPAAVGAGAGIAGTAAYNHYKQDDTANNNEPDLQQQAAKEAAQIDDSGHEANSTVAPINTFPAAANDAPASINRDIASAPALSTPTYDAPAPSTINNPSIDTQVAGNGPNGTYLSYPSSTGSGLAGSSDTPVSPMDGGLGGLESRGAHETGHIFPSVVRHNTDISVSQLHVPGEFPKKE
jgi:hypothetical protein